MSTVDTFQDSGDLGFEHFNEDLLRLLPEGAEREQYLTEVEIDQFSELFGAATSDGMYVHHDRLGAVLSVHGYDNALVLSLVRHERPAVHEPGRLGRPIPPTFSVESLILADDGKVYGESHRSVKQDKLLREVPHTVKPLKDQGATVDKIRGVLRDLRLQAA